MMNSSIAQTRVFLAVLAIGSTINTYWIGKMFSSRDERQVRVRAEEQEWQQHYHSNRQIQRVITGEPKDNVATSLGFPVLDMISVGSKTRWDLVLAQNTTFGQHPTVRNFFTFTEDDDHETHCHSNLTYASTRFVSEYCRRNQHTKEMRKFRSRFARLAFLEKKGNPAGWLCAQKRPAESLYRVLDGYRQQRQRLLVDGNESEANFDEILPDYLFLLDDDTYLNMRPILDILPATYPANSSYAVAGCMVRERLYQHNFTFPWGGFGTIFSRSLIEKFLHPIRCHANDSIYNLTFISTTSRELSLNEFGVLVCQRLAQDVMGEAFLFQQGMNVADLMYKFVTYWQYANAEKDWNRMEGPGFCMHADWVIGYFINTYYLGRHTGVDVFRDHTDDRFRGWQGSCAYAGANSAEVDKNRKQCNYDGDENCIPEAHFCHHVTPQKDAHNACSTICKCFFRYEPWQEYVID